MKRDAASKEIIKLISTGSTTGLTASLVAERILNARADVHFLYAAVQAVGEEGEMLTLRNPILAKAFIDCILHPASGPSMAEDDDGFGESAERTFPRHWEVPLIGLMRLLMPYETDDPDICSTIHASILDVVNIIWEDMYVLLHGGPLGDYRRELVSRTLTALTAMESQR